MTRYVKMFRCKACGHVYPLMPYFPAAAPHGPNRDCNCRDWEPVRLEVDSTGAFVEGDDNA